MTFRARLLRLWLGVSGAVAAQAATPPPFTDIPARLAPPEMVTEYVKREEMIPMRDGVRLHTVIVMRKGAAGAPMILSRTPYNASSHADREESPRLLDIVPQGDDVLMADDYIRVFQDVRGKYGSEGDYVMARPLRGPLNGTATDHSTDAYDTIDWLVKHVPESNGRVGIIGSSYDGFTALMALVHPHPALKAAIPMCALVDGWRGDDWFHNGAFRQVMLGYLYFQTGAGDGARNEAHRLAYDDYTDFLDAGSVGSYARRYGIDQLPVFNKMAAHPAYDAYWRGQALDQLLAAQPLKVPTLHVGALWDQEDIYGPVHAYAAMEPADTGNDRNFLVLGPWRHSGMSFEGDTLGPLRFDGDTALQFRRDVMKPFLDRYLKEGPEAPATPPVLVFETGSQRWRKLDRWPPSCASGCPEASRKLYLQPAHALAFAAPPVAAASGVFDEYVSDPEKPIPFIPRPARFSDVDAWHNWLVSDQRFASDRTDVLTYVTEPLAQPLRISGIPIVSLFASTSGTDSDWIVKLIDAYPDDLFDRREMSGYQLGIAMDIFRGRYRHDLGRPRPVPAGKVERYRFELPAASHVFLPGHRVMVQIQSSWFPLYDRNPQTYVENIFFAQPLDYRKATQRVHRAGRQASFIELPVVSDARSLPLRPVL